MDNVHRTRVLAMRSLLSDEVDRHKKDFEPTNKRDFIDAFIAEIKNSGEDDESAFHESEGYEQLVQTLIDLVRERVSILILLESVCEPVPLPFLTVHRGH